MQLQELINNAIRDYAVKTLMASYWYRIAFDGLPLTAMPDSLTGKRHYAYQCALWYDTQAVLALSGHSHQTCADASRLYTALYGFYRDSAFSFFLLNELIDVYQIAA